MYNVYCICYVELREKNLRKKSPEKNPQSRKINPRKNLYII